jgi:putative transposase
MSRKGNPYDNARIESFFKMLKYEEVCKYEMIEDVMKRLPFFIEEAYNHERLHSAVNYQSPNDFEEIFFIQQKRFS